MKFRLTLLILCLFQIKIQAQDFQTVHENAILVDTHNDALSKVVSDGFDLGKNLKGKTHTDLDRLKNGGVDVQIFSIFCDQTFGPGKAYAYANREIDSLYSLAARNPEKMQIVKNPSDLSHALKNHKLAAMMGVEGGHMIEDNLSNLEKFYQRGVRYMTLTWNNSTSWASSAKDESSPNSLLKEKGLSPFGKQIVRKMNELGMLVDLSHVGEQTFWDAIHLSTKPILVSHSCVYKICPVFRNLKDDQILAVGKNGGVIQVNFFSGFIDSTYLPRFNEFMKIHQSEMDSLTRKNVQEYAIMDYFSNKYPNETEALKPPLSKLLDHIDYIVKLIGVDHVGLGSDFDGINSSPRTLDDVSTFPLITKALMERGYTENQIDKILGGNFIRVFKANSPK